MSYCQMDIWYGFENRIILSINTFSYCKEMYIFSLRRIVSMFLVRLFSCINDNEI